MSASTESLGDADPAPDVRQRIVDSAQHLFSWKGYRGTSVNAVAASAGVTTGAVYYYFGSKARLYSETGSNEVAGMASDYEGYVKGVPSETGRRERIKALFQSIGDEAVEHVDRHRNGIAVSLDAARYEVAAQARDRWSRDLDDVYVRVAGVEPDLRPGEPWNYDRICVLIEILVLGIARYTVRYGPEALPPAIEGLGLLVDAKIGTAAP